MQVDCRDLYQYRHVLSGYFRKRRIDINDADDIIHNIFLNIYSKNTDVLISNPAGYLMGAARNALIDRSRRRNPLNNALPLAVDDEDFAVDPEQERDRQAADLMRAYEAALAELSPRCRGVFVMRRHHDSATPEIAERFGISHRMVQKYLVKATAHLEAQLRPLFTQDMPNHERRTSKLPAAAACSPGYQLCDLV